MATSMIMATKSATVKTSRMDVTLKAPPIPNYFETMKQWLYHSKKKIQNKTKNKKKKESFWTVGIIKSEQSEPIINVETKNMSLALIFILSSFQEATFQLLTPSATSVMNPQKVFIDLHTFLRRISKQTHQRASTIIAPQSNTRIMFLSASINVCTTLSRH